MADQFKVRMVFEEPPTSNPVTFGKALRLIGELLGEAKYGLRVSSNRPAEFLSEISDCNITSVYPWLRGELHTSNNPLTNKNLFKLCKSIWENQFMIGLQIVTPKDLVSLVSYAGDKYKEIINNEEFLGIFSSGPYHFRLEVDTSNFSAIKDDPKAELFLPGNTKHVLETQINGKTKALIITGPHGHGKTEALTYLIYHATTKMKWYDGIHYISVENKTKKEVFSEFCSQILGFSDSLINKSLGINQLKNLIKGQRLFLLLDDVEDPNILEIALALDASSSSLAITSTDPHISDNITNFPIFHFPLSKLTIGSAIRYIECEINKKEAKKHIDTVQELLYFLNFNPAAFSIAMDFALTNGFKQTLKYIIDIDHPLPDLLGFVDTPIRKAIFKAEKQIGHMNMMSFLMNSLHVSGSHDIPGLAVCLGFDHTDTKTMDTLLNAGLIQQEDYWYVVNRLVYRFVRRLMLTDKYEDVYRQMSIDILVKEKFFWSTRTVSEKFLIDESRKFADAFLSEIRS